VNMNRFFSYDFDTGFDTHGSLDEARAAAEASLAYWRDMAASEGEWPEDALSVCYGEIHAQVVEVHSEDGTVDYRLTDGRGTA
jgi:hypothetical protein